MYKIISINSNKISNVIFFVFFSGEYSMKLIEASCHFSAASGIYDSFTYNRILIYNWTSNIPREKRKGNSLRKNI